MPCSRAYRGRGRIPLDLPRLLFNRLGLKINPSHAWREPGARNFFQFFGRLKSLRDSRGGPQNLALHLHSGKEPPMQRQRRRAGDVVRIELGAGFHTYARVLPEAWFAFYDCRVVVGASLPEILASQILFRITVMNHAVKTGRWPVIGHDPLKGAMLVLPPKFIQDPIDKTIFSIYENGMIRAATSKQCPGLERASLWEPEHVEDRLRAHYAGNLNHVVELLKQRDCGRTKLLEVSFL